MTNNNSFAGGIVCEKLASPLLLADGSMVDPSQPEDLAIVLKEHFGDNFERCLKDQKLLLIEIISSTLRNGGSFFEIADRYNVGNLLPIPVMGSELNWRSAVQLLQELTAALAD